MLIGVSAGVAVAAGLGAAVPPAGAALVVVADETPDKLIMRDGKVIEGTILEETATDIRINVVVAGISAPTTFSKADVLRIVRGDRDEAPKTIEDVVREKGGDAGEGGGLDDAAADNAGLDNGLTASGVETPRVYYLPLTGEFGRDIAPTPIRDALEDAARRDPDYLIVYLDNEWEVFGEDAGDDATVTFDVFTIADKIDPIFAREIEQMFDEDPQVVFWVRTAMGGAAFLPFMADRIYFHPEGRMGGVGTLEDLFEGTGDEVVRQKQRSLRLARAQGLAIAGGYPYQIVTAMARRSYVLSYTVERGEVVFLERMPERQLEFLLTDDGAGANVDSLADRVRGRANDTLTLRGEEAVKVGVAEGLAQSVDDVLAGLNILRNHEMVDGRAERIMEGWSEDVRRAERSIPRLFEEFDQVQGDTPEETINRRIRILEEIRGLWRKYGEAFDPFGDGIGQLSNINVQIEQLRAELIALRG